MITENANAEAIFELAGTGLADATPDVLGVWTATPATPGEAVAFDTAAAPATDAPVWRANLPADPELAEAELAGGETRLGASHAALTEAQMRLDAFVAARTAGPAFDVPGTGAEGAAPEAELWLLLQEIEQGRPPPSFGLGDTLVGKWEQANQQFQAFIEQVSRLVAYYALVETRQAGRIVGRTAVGWTGDVDTVWPAATQPDQADLHRRTLALALASRDALVRMVALVTSGAVKLSVLLTTPGGAVLALPAAWKFINRVLAELERHQQSVEET